MKRGNVVQEKAYAFALRIVKLYRYLCEEKKEFVLSKQIVRSGTSIGANIEEAIGGQSDRDFLACLRNQYKLFCAEEDRELDLQLIDYGDIERLPEARRNLLTMNC